MFSNVHKNIAFLDSEHFSSGAHPPHEFVAHARKLLVREGRLKDTLRICLLTQSNVRLVYAHILGRLTACSLRGVRVGLLLAV